MAIIRSRRDIKDMKYYTLFKSYKKPFCLRPIIKPGLKEKFGGTDAVFRRCDIKIAF